MDAEKKGRKENADKEMELEKKRNDRKNCMGIVIRGHDEWKLK
jgi:hypothetical protein